MELELINASYTLEMGTACLDGVRRFETLRLLHWIPMAYALHPDDKSVHT